MALNAYVSQISQIPLNHVTSIIHLKLKEDNFITWKSLSLPLLKRYWFLGLIDGSIRCPPKFLNQADLDAGLVNQHYTDRTDDDNTLIRWIQSTISDVVIPYVVGANSSRELCLNIDSRFART